MRRLKDGEIGFGIYDLKRTPAPSPGPLKPRVPQVGGRNARRRSRLAADTSSFSSSQAVQQYPVAASAALVARGGKPTNFASTAPSSTTPATSVAPATTTTGSSSSTGSGGSTRSALEDLLVQLARVEHVTLSPTAQQTVQAVLECLRQDRRHRRAGRPTRRLSYLGSDDASGAETHVARCLAAACQLHSLEETIQALSGFLLSSASPSTLPSRSDKGDSTCLVAAALAELRICFSGAAQVSEADLELLDSAVSEGHPGAMLRVGLCLRDGLGVPADLETALTWMEQAAALGYAPAMHELGEVYERGATVDDRTVEEDWGAAMHWYRQAASLGYVPSQLNLGRLLLTASEEADSRSVLPAPEAREMRERAKEWLDRAAASGSQEAMLLRRRTA